MAIEIKCPGCGKILKFADTAAGSKSACPQCNTLLFVGKFRAVEAQPVPPEPVWNSENVFPVFSGHSGSVNSVAFSQSGFIGISAGDDSTIRLWHLEDGHEAVRLEGHSGPVLCARLSHDGGFAVSGGEDHTVRLWNVRKTRCVSVFEGHEGPVTSVAFHPFGGFLYSASADRTLRKWDLSSGKCVARCKGHASAVTSIAVDPAGRFVISASLDKTLRVWRCEKPKCIGKLKGHGGPIRSVTLNYDGNLAVSCGDDRTAIIWSVPRLKMLEILKGHFAPVHSVAINFDNTTAATGSADWAMRIWNVDTASTAFVLETGQESVSAVAFQPGGWEVLAGYGSGSVRLWNALKGAAVRTLGGTEHSADTRCPSCAQVFALPSHLIGRDGLCPFCRSRFTASLYWPEKSQEALTQGQKAVASGDLNRALAEFDEAVRCQGDNHEAILNNLVCRNRLAATLVETDKFKQALTILDRAIRLYSADKYWPLEIHQTARLEAYMNRPENF